MSFNTYEFLVFLPVVAIVYYIMPRKLKVVWLLLSSFYFYMSWNPKFIFLLIVSITVTYITGRLVEKYKFENNVRLMKTTVVIGTVINIGMLVYFKYIGFMAQTFDRAFAKLFGGGPVLYKIIPDIILPVGISFFTFQAIGYTIDVYRGEIVAERNIIRYALFVSFFPQLVAGPIERSKNLLPQIKDIDSKRIWNYEGIVRGLILTLWGFFMKIVIADRLSLITDPVFDNQSEYGSSMLILAAICFSLQIYCDFAGYSMIAIGTAKMFGIRLMENFNTPYFASDIRNFWSRWHISLSTWFRDYLYFPLGGSRCSKGKAYFNLMITFLVSGLWHGAAAKFIIWGGINGLLQVISREISPAKNRFYEFLNISKNIIIHFIEIFVCFMIATVTWVVFRANSLRLAVDYYLGIITKRDFRQFITEKTYNNIVSDRDIVILLVALSVLLLVGLVRNRRGKMLDEFLMSRCIVARISVMLFLLFYIILFGYYGEDVYTQPFVYFQF